MGYQPRPSGGLITDPDVAYIRSDGNDTTGDGSPSAPYLTVQKAVNEGFTYIDVGVLNAGPIAVTGGVSVGIRVSGRGPGSIIGAITTQGGGVTIVDVGVQSVTLGNITTMNLVEGNVGGIVSLYNAKAGAINTTPTSSGSAATPGGEGGPVVLIGQCTVDSVVSDGAANTDGGAGGAGGAVTISGPCVVLTSVSLVGGAGAPPGSDGVLTVIQGGSVPTPSPDAAVVVGADINGVFFTNTYP